MGIPLASIMVSALACAGTAASADAIDYRRAMQDIARDIAALKPRYAQLAQFDASMLDGGEAKISYAFHTHAPPRSGGWTSGVPNPDSDGLWFYIDLHDADSTPQIHTQPLTRADCLGDKRVSFLILEGERSESVEAEIAKILQRHGVRACADHGH